MTDWNQNGVDQTLSRQCDEIARLTVCIAEQQAEIERLKADNAAMVKQWNDLDCRNEKRHREWNAQFVEARKEIDRLRGANEKMQVLYLETSGERNEAREAARKMVVALSAGKRLWFEAEYPWLEERR